MPSRLGIDVSDAGANFLLLDEATGATRSLKPAGPAGAETIGQAIRDLTDRAGIRPGEIETVVGGTDATPGEVRVGMLVTRGFEHVLHLGRSSPVPVGLDLTEGVAERISAEGNTITQLDEAAAGRAINRLLQAGAEALAICLLNAHASPAHELALREIAHRIDDRIPVVLSHEVAPEPGEHDRALATVLAAQGRSALAGRLDMLVAGLKQAEISPQVFVAGSDGGRSGAEAAAEDPIGTIGASRAGAAAAAARIAAAASFPDALVLDLGGAAANAALVRGGSPRVSSRTAIGRAAIPRAALDVRRIAGGSRSVAALPYAGAIGLGAPGSGPGPTVAEANIVLGRVPPLRGSDQAGAAEQAVADFAGRAGLDVHRAAEGIVEIFNERLAGALRLVAAQKGEDPERMALVACGGAGPMHGCAIGALAGSSAVIVPVDAGSLAALGFVTAEVSRQFSQGIGRRLDRLSAHDMADIVRALRARADAWLGREGVTGEIAYRADLRVFRGHFQVSSSIDPQSLAEPGGLAALADKMDEAHRRRFGTGPSGPVEIVALRAIATAPAPGPTPLRAAARGSDPRAALVDQIQAWFDGAFVATSVFQRDLLSPGNRVLGPALVVETDTTTVIGPGHGAEVDAQLNLLVRPDGGAGRGR